MDSKPLLLFDMDGTLIMPKVEELDRETNLHMEGIKSRQEMKRIAYLYGVPEVELKSLNRMAHVWNAARRYAEINGFDEVIIKRLMADLNVAFNRQETLEHSVSHLLPGAIETLRSLCTSYRLGIVTTASRAGYDRISRSENFGTFGMFFTHSVTRDESSYLKPDPAPIYKALEAYGCRDFLYLGDSDHDAEAARAAGGRFILVNTRPYIEEMVQMLDPEGVVSDLRDLPGVVSTLFSLENA